MAPKKPNTCTIFGHVVPRQKHARITDVDDGTKNCKYCSMPCLRMQLFLHEALLSTMYSFFKAFSFLGILLCLWTPIRDDDSQILWESSGKHALSKNAAIFTRGTAFNHVQFL